MSCRLTITFDRICKYDWRLVTVDDSSRKLLILKYFIIIDDFIAGNEKKYYDKLLQQCI